MFTTRLSEHKKIWRQCNDGMAESKTTANNSVWTRNSLDYEIRTFVESFNFWFDHGWNYKQTEERKRYRILMAKTKGIVKQFEDIVLHFNMVISVEKTERIATSGKLRRCKVCKGFLR